MNSENIMTDLEAIQNDLYPKTTLEGSYITAENTVEGLRGVVSADEETEVTTMNKNLFNYLNRTPTTKYGFTASIDKETGYISIEGTPTQNYANVLESVSVTSLLEDGETYTLWQENHTDDDTCGIYLQVKITDINGTTTQVYARDKDVTFTVDKATYPKYEINVLSSTIEKTGTIENYKNRYMLYKGTEDRGYVLPKSKTYTVSDKTEIRTYDDITHIYNTDDVNMTVEVRERKE